MAFLFPTQTLVTVLKDTKKLCLKKHLCVLQEGTNKQNPVVCLGQTHAGEIQYRQDAHFPKRTAGELH